MSRLAALFFVRAPEMARQGLRHLGAYPMRTAIALSGIVIGVSAVVGSMALLDGVERMVRDSFERFLGGTQAGVLRPRLSATASGRQIDVRKLFALDPEDGAALEAALSEVEATAALVSGRSTVAVGTKQFDGVYVGGTGPNYLSVRRFEIEAGRFLSAEDGVLRQRVVVLFSSFAQELFGEEVALQREVLIDGQRFTVVGLLRPMGGGKSAYWRRAFVPWETAVYRQGRDPRETSLWVKVGRGDFDALVPTFFQILVGRHPGSRPQDFRNFRVGRMPESVLRTIHAQGDMLVAVATLCLLASGIGILNVFLISVTERTPEIGLRRALGATRRDVFAQFVFEAVVLCCIGGAIGLLGAQAVAAGFAGPVKEALSDDVMDAARLSVAIGARGVAVAFVLSFATAVVFGSFPAWRASRLDPAASMRFE